MMNKNIIHTAGKRKRAIARATLRPGTGIVRINKILLDHYSPEMFRDKITEPLIIAEDLKNKVNIDINVYGGGVSSQAEAARLAIGRGLVLMSKDKKLENEMIEYDRQLLVADVRRKESSKPNCRGQARAKKQKSYR